MAKQQAKLTNIDLVRNLIANDPDATPTKLVEKLKSAHGVAVTNSQASRLKWAAKHGNPPAKPAAKRKYKKRRRRATSIRRVSVSTLTDVVGLLTAAKELAKQAGGVAQARTLLDLLEDA